MRISCYDSCCAVRIIASGLHDYFGQSAWQTLIIKDILFVVCSLKQRHMEKQICIIEPPCVDNWFMITFYRYSKRFEYSLCCPG